MSGKRSHPRDGSRPESASLPIPDGLSPKQIRHNVDYVSGRGPANFEKTSEASPIPGYPSGGSRSERSEEGGHDLKDRIPQGIQPEIVRTTRTAIAGRHQEDRTHYGNRPDDGKTLFLQHDGWCLKFKPVTIPSRRILRTKISFSGSFDKTRAQGQLTDGCSLPGS